VVSRFVQERSILTSISHPNVVRVIDLVVEGDTLGIVIEMVRGRDLRRALSEARTQPPAMAVGLFRQVLAGLTAVHAAGVLHRDIKPENILLDFYGSRMQVKLTDFGIARLTYGTALTRTTGLIGTPEYMAPETAEHGTATLAADLYSAGTSCTSCWRAGPRSEAVLRWRCCGARLRSLRRPFPGSRPVSGRTWSRCWPRTRAPGRRRPRRPSTCCSP
jgi:serine/threonine protein kinase